MLLGAPEDTAVAIPAAAHLLAEVHGPRLVSLKSLLISHIMIRSGVTTWAEEHVRCHVSLSAAGLAARGC
eukprot:SAG11_NODE_24622_length_370_cov_1.512915_1_plen_70_part_10